MVFETRFLFSGSSTTLETLVLLFVMPTGGSVWMIIFAAEKKKKNSMCATTWKVTVFTNDNM